MKKTMRRTAAILFSLLMTFAVAAAPAAGPDFPGIIRASAATTFSDINGHWAKSYIQKAVTLGIVNGYNDGTFRPENNVTRAEFTKMLNTALGNNGIADANFSDVSSEQWFYYDVCKGVSAAFINGYSDGTFAPDNTISRQEAAVVLARIVPAAGSDKALDSFTDGWTVADWARPSMEKIVGKGYMTGAYNELTPAAFLTRGQAAKIIVELCEGENIISKNQTIVKDEITIKDTIYANQISVGSQVADGTAILENSTVLGNVNVLGGGSESGKGVILKDSRAAKLTVARSGAAALVSATGESTVVNTYIDESAVLQEDSAASVRGDFGKGFVNVYMNRKSDLELNGSISLLEFLEAKCDANIKNGSAVERILIDKDAARCSLVLEEGSTVSVMDIYGAYTVLEGKGALDTLNVYADNLTYQPTPKHLYVDGSVSVAPVQNIDPSEALLITLASPEEETEVPVGSRIELVFSSSVHAAGTRGVLTNAQAESLIQLKKGSSTGPNVSFTAVVNNNGRSVTLTPAGTLAHGTVYYIKIGRDDLTDEYNNTNDLFLMSFQTEGQKSSLSADLSALEAGVSDSSSQIYSTMAAESGANSIYYIGTDSRSVSVRAETSVPDPQISVTLNKDTRMIGTSGDAVSFTIPAGTEDPGVITVTAGSLDGDYAETTRTITLKRISPEIALAQIQLKGSAKESLELYNTVNAAAQAEGSAINVENLDDGAVLLNVLPAETASPEGISVVVEKYDPASENYTAVKSSDANVWSLGSINAAAEAGGIYRITLTSRICGSSPSNGTQTQTTEKYVKVTFTE